MKVWLSILGATLTVMAGVANAREKYVPPDGFAGHKWGDHRTEFTRLPDKPIGIGASWMPAIVTDQYINCVPTIGGEIDLTSCLLSMYERREGGGFYVMSEYSIEGQGFKFGESDPVVMYPVVYQFCANWSAAASKRTPPPNFDSINQFCGVKLMFQNETLAELDKLPADHVSTYDRVLDKLIAKFGNPDGFMRRGVVTIESFDAEVEKNSAADRDFHVYRWCPAFDRRLHTPCTASVVLTLDPVTGSGAIYYSTPLLWEFAYAREHDFKGDKLFHVLHARQ